MKKYKNNTISNQLSIVDGMIDWVRVVDKNNTIIYANKKMQEDLGEIVGKKCYEVLCRSEKCEQCISSVTFQSGSVVRKHYNIDNKTYMIVSSPLFGDDGVIEGSVEVFRDITNEVSLTKRISDKNKKMSEDINFAKNMQNRMLPPKGMYNGLSIDYLYESSDYLSGDYFDVFEIDEDNTGVYICDVVGHGVTASLLTIFVRQSLRTIAKGNININRIMKELHKTFLALNLDYDKYFSVFFGIYKKNNHEFTYVNAGHNSIPILLNKKSLKMLEAKGYPIANIFDSVSYDVGKVDLSLGDRILFYTDGITETTNNEGIQFGVENFVNIVKSGGNILENITVSLNNFSKVHKDDYAVLLIEVI